MYNYQVLYSVVICALYDILVIFRILSFIFHKILYFHKLTYRGFVAFDLWSIKLCISIYMFADQCLFITNAFTIQK